MSIFNGLEGAKTFERGTYMTPGIYDVRIARVICKETQTSGLAVIVEMDILTSKSRPQDDPKHEGRVWNPTPAGIQGTWFQSMTDKSVALPAIKGFLHAALGLRPNDSRVERLDQPIAGSESWPTNPTRRPVPLVSNLMEHAIEKNLLAGCCVHLECSIILTQKKKEDFTLYRFTPADYALLGMSSPNLDMILPKAMMPIGAVASPQPSTPAWRAPSAPPAHASIATFEQFASPLTPPPWNP